MLQLALAAKTAAVGAKGAFLLRHQLAAAAASSWPWAPPCWPQNQMAAAAPLSTSAVLSRKVAGKYYNRWHLLRKKEELHLTYDMLRRPHHIGSHKAWMTWHTHQLYGFHQQQALTIAQDEVIRRFVRAILFDYLPDIIGPTELVIKRRGNAVYVSGFLCFGEQRYTYGRLDKLYWLWGFCEEILTNLLKQPVKLELQMVRKLEEMLQVTIKPK